MKPKTYFRLTLLFPYLLWCICALTVYILSLQDTSTAWDTALMPVFFYTFGILLWFVPYTLLAVGLLIWSRNKPTATLRKAAMIAPLLFAVLMLIESTLVSLPFDNAADYMETMPGQTALLGGFSLVFGYMCVGIALGFYKLLQTRGLIQEENSSLLPES